MPTIGTSIDISGLVDATVAGDSDRIITAARRLLQQGAPAAELAGRYPAGPFSIDPDFSH